MKIILTAGLMCAAAPSGAESPAAAKSAGEAAEAAAAVEKIPPRPASRRWTAIQKGTKKFVYTFDFRPAIPTPDQVTELLVTVSETPKRPHPRFGNRVPVANADLIVEAWTPAGELVHRYKAHPMPLALGKYGIHITPDTDGIYTMRVVGTSAEGDALRVDAQLPVNVWPLPKALQGGGAAKSGGRRRPVSL